MRGGGDDGGATVRARSTENVLNDYRLAAESRFSFCMTIIIIIIRRDM